MPTTTRTGSRISLIHEAFARVAAERRREPAVSCRDRSITYGELDERAERLAGGLVARGVAPGTVVALLMERDIEVVVAALAVVKAGVAFLPLDPGHPDTQLEHVLRTVRAEVLITDAVDRCPSGPAPMSLGTVAQGPWSSSRVRVGPHDLAFVNQTSGSTHQPKAVGISHHSAAVAADGWLDRYSLRGDPVPHLQYAGTSFDVFVADLLRCLLSGGELVVCPSDVRLDPPALADLIEARGIAFAEFTPTLLGLLVEYLEAAGRRLPGLRTLALGGEPWLVETYHRLSKLLPNATIVNTYGLAETTIDNLAHFGPPPAGAAPGEFMPLGHPHPGTELIVVDPETGYQATGGAGELVIGGDCVASGYLGQPELSAQRFVADPRGRPGLAVRTGDLVRVADDGAFTYVGRCDDQVKIRGVRVMLREVESALLTHPQVRQAAVVATTGPDGTELVAHLAADGEPPVVELCAAIARTAGPHAVPARFVHHASLPVNVNGKMDRKRLAAAVPPEYVRTSSAATAKTPSSAPPAPEPADPAGAVRAAWGEVFGRPSFQDDDHFFAMGGDSVSAVRMVMRVGRALGVRIPADWLHRHPTFAGFLERLATEHRPAGAIPSRPDPREHPPTPRQRRLWLMWRLNPGDLAYVVPTTIDLAGELDEAALATALTGIVTRHEPLRTIFVDRDGEPVCRVLDPAPVQIDVESVTDEEHARERAAHLIQQPFALDEEPPLRARLLRLSAGRHWLVLLLHHIATDQESERVLLEELGRAYRAAPTTPPSPGVSYGDIAAWQDAQTQDDLPQRLEYWRQRLEGHRSLPLPLEGTATESRGAGTRRTVRLEREVARRLRLLASRQRTTPFVALMAALAELVGRRTGERDVCLGYPLSRREPAESEGLVGFFVDTSIVRVRWSGDSDYRSLVDRVRDEVAAGLAHGVSYDLLAEQHGRNRPLFHVWFNHLGAEVEPPELAGLRTALVEPPVAPALFDLNLYVSEQGEDIRIDLVHDPSVCSAEAAEEVLEQYAMLLRAAATAPDTVMRRHRLTTARAARLLPDPEGPLEHEPVEPSALARRLLRSSRRAPDRLAVRGPDGDLTHHDLRRVVRGLRHSLRQAGVQPGDVVAVHAEYVPHLVGAVLGVLAVGGRLLLLDAEYPADRLNHYLGRARPRCVVTLGPRPVPADLTVVSIAQDGSASTTAAAVREPDTTSFDSAGYVAFTSGTTGEPAGVVGRLEPIVHFLRWYCAEFGLGPADRFALLAGLSHDPLFRDVLTPLWACGVLCVPTAETRSTPGLLLRWLAREHVTVLHLTPPLARLLLEASRGSGVRLPAVRLIVLAGDAPAPSDVAGLATLAPAAVLVNGYGTTETPQLVSWRVLRPGRPVALGPGAPGSRLLVVDAEGRSCGFGEVGQIVVRSRWLAEALPPGEGFQPDPVPGVGRFATGDLGRYRMDGSVAFEGRAGTLVKVRGHRVNPAEVDAALMRDPSITASVTLAVPGPDGAELVSYVVPARPRPSVVPRLRDRLRATLPPAFMPRSITEVPRLPLTPNGKVDLAALPEVSPAPSGVRPKGRLEERLAGIWSTVLAVPDPGVTDNFFDLGGTSLKLARVHSMIRREFGESVSLLTLYENPTIRTLAGRLTLAEPPGLASERRVHDRLESERARRLIARSGRL
ncbi:amino acid adenylation domain-containing protein [Nonomuraea sp. NPDC049695]|uniref:amino acid adenylation domain-containing protein n=1 Tax=Nonomuraea sp. NPDC049695 TaxID=3154734 RepID=UPI00342CE9C0